MISAVLFDFDHTLGTDRHLEFDMLKELAAEVCGHPPSDEDVGAGLAEFRDGSVPLEAMVTDALREWGCPAALLDEMPERYKQMVLREAPNRVKPVPGARDTLAELHKNGMPIGILSNGWTELQHLKADIIEFPGPTLASVEIGAWKPDPRAFTLAAERLQMKPSSTLYVGDSPEVDVVGAKRAGMLAAWADFENSLYRLPSPKPDYILKSLPQLLDIL